MGYAMVSGEQFRTRTHRSHDEGRKSVMSAGTQNPASQALVWPSYDVDLGCDEHAIALIAKCGGVYALTA